MKCCIAILLCLATTAQAVDLRGLPIVVPAEMSEESRAAVDDLAAYLSRMVGGEFVVEKGAAGGGIAVGRFDAFEPAVFAERFDANDPTRREEYIIRSHEKGLQLIGATEMAVPHAVWDLLYRLGHRQYLPGEKWEIVPTLDDSNVNFDVFESPDYINRRIINGGGYFDYDKEPSYTWSDRNRMGLSFRVPASHMYDRIVHMERDTFKEHPEWTALIDGKRKGQVRTGNKFCISNPELRDFIGRFAIKYCEKYPQNDGMSLDPSDGEGWCECEPCNTQFATITDRVVTLANQTVVTLNEHFDEPKYIGMLAYGSHSPPPTITPHPNLVVMVTKGYLRGGYTFEQLLQIWGDYGLTMGNRDYLGVVQWSWDRPGRGRSTRRNYAKTLPPFFEKGIRLYIAESEGNWGPAGVNYHIISRVLWDCDEADRIDEIFDEFIALCFPNSGQPIRKFYDLINGDNQPLLSRDLIGRMYRQLDAARNLTSDKAERDRIDDLTIYARYVEMYFDYSEADGEERQALFEKLMRFIWRTRHHMMVHSREIYRQLHRVDTRVSIPDNATYRVRESENPWMDTTPVTQEEFATWVAEGVESNEVQSFEPVNYSMDLIPATPLGLKEIAPGTFRNGTQNYQEYYTWFDKPGSVELTVTGGLIRHYRDRGDARIQLYQEGEAPDHIIDEGSVPPDGEPRQVVLTAPSAGLYRIEVHDGGDRTRLEWEEGVPMTFVSDAQTRVNYPISYTAHFYVPKGTTRVAGYCAVTSGEMRNADNETVLDFSDMSAPGYFDVPVPPGQDGKLWMLRRCKGKRMLMTVPPSLARSADELLLPREVVQKDAP